MLISRLALTLFWFPGVCPLRLEYFHIPQKDYGFLFLFSLFNFQGPVRSLFSVKRLTILSHFVVFVKNFFQKFFGSFFRKELFNSITSFDVCQELFSLSLFAELFYLTTTNQGLSRFFSAPLSA